LQDRMTHRPGDLSGGQQQRVAVARAIALDPPLILADEPTAHLDYLQVEEMLRLIRSLATGDRMVVVATHDPRLLPLADRVIEMAPNTTLVNRAHETIQLKAGTVLFNQGALADLIYVVSEGELEMVRQRPGGPEAVRVVKAGDHFGEIGPLFGLPRSATVRARTDAAVIGYSVPDFRHRVSSAAGPGLNEGRELAMD
jgi:putative ABC transport system ATP-binding protein